MEQNCFALRQIPSNGNLLLPAGIYLAIRGNGALRIRPNNPARISPALSGEICRYLDESCKHAQGFISASVPSSCMLAGKKTKCNFHDHVTQEPFSTIRGEADSTSRQRSPWRGQVSTNAAMLSFLHQFADWRVSSRRWSPCQCWAAACGGKTNVTSSTQKMAQSPAETLRFGFGTARKPTVSTLCKGPRTVPGWEFRNRLQE